MIKLTKKVVGDRIMTNETWISNGHWMVARALLNPKTAAQYPSEDAYLAALHPKVHTMGVGSNGNGVRNKLPRFEAVIPAGDGTLVERTPWLCDSGARFGHAVIFKDANGHRCWGYNENFIKALFDGQHGWAVHGDTMLCNADKTIIIMAMSVEGNHDGFDVHDIPFGDIRELAF